MIIRSITYTINLDKIESLDYQKIVQARIDRIRSEFEKDQIKIRTVRFNTTLIDLNHELSLKDYRQKLLKVRQLSRLCDVRWFNLPVNLCSSSSSVLKSNCDVLLTLIREFSELFVNVVLPPQGLIEISKLKELVKLLSSVSKISSMVTIHLDLEYHAIQL